MVALSTKKHPPEHAKHLAAYKWQPGQSGNPKGRTPGSRNRLAEDFIRDIHEKWTTHGAAVLDTVAMLEPGVFLRVVASLMPKEIETTISVKLAERMSDDELIHLAIADRRDDLAAQEEPEILQPVE